MSLSRFLLCLPVFLITVPAQSFAGEEGKQLYQQCIACHQADASGNQALKAPALAGQDSWYLENQLKAFRSKYRGSAEGDTSGAGMAALAAGLKDKDINELSSYLNSLPKVELSQSVGGDSAKGKQYYDTLCGSCHGPSGKGNQSLNSPKLSGLNDWYLVEQLNKFRSGQRGYHEQDKLGRQMKMMAGILPDEQAIKDVASYLSSQ